MTGIDDFFELPDGPPRDQYGRPLLMPAGHDPECPDCKGLPALQQPHRQWYTRSSSLSDMLTDFAHIHKWKMRYLARAMGYHRDLAMLAAAECYTTGFDKGEEAENRASGRRLDDIIERALDRQGIAEKADYGTAVHAWTEPGNDGHVFESAQADVDSFKEAVERTGSVILGTELFVANDTLRTAGTFDHLMWITGYGICITDKKTSSKVDGHNYGIQLATYADEDTHLYDWETDTRMTLEDYVAARGWDPALINRKVGIIHWIKDGETSHHEIDLELGREAAGHATWVRDVHRKGTGQRKVDKEIATNLRAAREGLMEGIQCAPDVDTLTRIWNDPELRAVWTDEHTAAAVARKAEIHG